MERIVSCWVQHKALRGDMGDDPKSLMQKAALGGCGLQANRQGGGDNCRRSCIFTKPS